MRPAVFGFEYARIRVPDMAATGAFYQRHVGLDLSEAPGDHLYLRSELEHHCLDIVQGPAGEPAVVTALGYSVLDTESLAACLTAAGAAARGLASVTVAAPSFSRPVFG